MHTLIVRDIAAHLLRLGLGLGLSLRQHVARRSRSDKAQSLAETRQRLEQNFPSAHSRAHLRRHPVRLPPVQRGSVSVSSDRMFGTGNMLPFKCNLLPFFVGATSR